MPAIVGHLNSLSPYDDVASAIITEALRRGYDPVPVLATAIQESSLRPTAVSSNGQWIGLFQQDASYPGRHDPNTQITGFFDRLDAKRAGNGWEPGSLWFNIFWLQQRPSEPDAATAVVNGRGAYLDEIQSRTSEARRLVDLYAAASGAVLDTMKPEAGVAAVTGDPVWLEDVLRPALGDRLRTLPEWKIDGVGGTMGRIWGTIWHHTGNSRETAESISRGRPDLPGPLSQLHIAPTGIVTIVAVGPCNHAGLGSWSGLPTDNANPYTIGVECAWPDIRPDGSYNERQPWPAEQVRSMVDVAVALTTHLGQPASHNISHQEWAKFGPAGWRQGKWDPGNFDMDAFRATIQARMDAPGTPAEPTPPAAGTELTPEQRMTLELHRQFLGRWEMLAWRTPVEALAVLLDAHAGTENAGKKGWRPA